MSQNQHTKPKALIFEEILEIVKQKGGACLSQLSDYKTGHSKLKFKCKIPSHPIWEATGFSIRNADSWCYECGVIKRAAAHKKAPIRLEEIKDIAKARHGVCLSDIYINSKSKLKFRCHNESHKIFEMSYANVKIGQWCPECSASLGERLVRTCFEQLFGRPFPKARPEWLRNKDGNKLELDGYCESLGIAFEHNGLQHYKTQTKSRLAYFSSLEVLDKIQAHDLIKNETCRAMKIELIIVTEVPTKIKITQLKEFILKKCYSKNIHVPFHDKEIDFNIVYYREYEKTMEELNNIAKSKNWKLLSKYFLGSHIPLEWLCFKCNFSWKACAKDIKRGNGCPSCARLAKIGKFKLGLNIQKEIIEKYLGDRKPAAFLADFYGVNWHTILRILRYHNIKIRPSYEYRHERGENGRFIK